MVFSKRFRKWVFESVDLDWELEEDDPLFEIMHLILNTRDEVMIKKIEAFWEAEPGYRGQAVGLFGAAHLPAIINHLVDRRGFRITDSRWVMAIPAE